MKAGAIASARYRLTFTCNTALLNEFLNQNTITAQKRSKEGVLKELDLKPSLEKADVTYKENDAVVIELTLPCSSTETINPMLIVETYQEFSAKTTGKEQPVFCDILRLQLLDQEGRAFA